MGESSFLPARRGVKGYSHWEEMGAVNYGHVSQGGEKGSPVQPQKLDPFCSFDGGRENEGYKFYVEKLFQA